MRYHFTSSRLGKINLIGECQSKGILTKKKKEFLYTTGRSIKYSQFKTEWKSVWCYLEK